MGKVLLVSITSPFGDLILDGKKTAELRKSTPRQVGPGDKVVLYETSPKASIIGEAEIREIIDGDPREVWRELMRRQEETCLPGRVFHQEYVVGRSKTAAILLQNPRRYKHKINLGIVENNWPDFRPPQSYCYISYKQYKKLDEIVLVIELQRILKEQFEKCNCEFNRTCPDQRQLEIQQADQQECFFYPDLKKRRGD